MKQKVTFELLQPLMCGGIRVTDNFLESESFIRGSVLRATFANSILLECPLAGEKTEDGKYHYVTLKDPAGRCKDCPHHDICEKFSDMTFSYAYPENSIPAPFTSKMCKKCGTEHPVKDILVKDAGLTCNLHGNNTADSRMENLKGLINMEGEAVKKVKVRMTLSTHTAINYHSHTADDGSLYSIKAIRKGQRFTAIIDDCGTDMLHIGDVVYTGKYSSCGFGKMKITDMQPVSEIYDEEISERIRAFNERFSTQNMVSVLFLSDAFTTESMTADKVLTNEEYQQYWTRILFGEGALPFSLKKIFTEVQLYGGYDTARSWRNWKKDPEQMLCKGTSLLLQVNEGCMKEAVALLTALQKRGIGKQTEDGFGQIEICHPIHCMGV